MKAAVVYQQALEVMKEALGSEHPDVATTLNNLAVLYRARGNYAAAEPLLKQSLKIAKKALGAEHPDVASVLNSQAELYRARGNYAAAEPLFKQSLKIMRDHFLKPV